MNILKGSNVRKKRNREGFSKIDRQLKLKKVKPSSIGEQVKPIKILANILQTDEVFS